MPEIATPMDFTRMSRGASLVELTNPGYSTDCDEEKINASHAEFVHKAKIMLKKDPTTALRAIRHGAVNLVGKYFLELAEALEPAQLVTYIGAGQFHSRWFDDAQDLRFHIDAIIPHGRRELEIYLNGFHR